MDPTQQKLMKVRSDGADETGQAGYFLGGGLALMLGGLALILQANAGVADFGGAMLALMGVALVAASIWLYGQRG